jgi:hypothetical protein
MNLIRWTILLGALLLGAALACDHPYFPIREGAGWSYQTSSPGLAPYSYQQSLRDVSAERFTMVSVFDDFTQEITWNCSESGLTATEYGSSTPGFTFETLAVSGVTMPPAGEWRVGTEWENSFEVQGSMTQEGVTVALSGTIATKSRIVAQEQIKVAAGSFTAHKIESQSAMRLVSNVLGMMIPMNFDSISWAWYAEGVGLVRSETDGSVTELTAYSIP